MADSRLKRRIPYHLPSIGADEVAAVKEVLRSGWLTTGSKAAQFEKEVAALTMAKYAVAVNSCTSGLHLALLALGVGPGDEVITTPYTFSATGETIVHTAPGRSLPMSREGGSISIPARSPLRLQQNQSHRAGAYGRRPLQYERDHASGAQPSHRRG